MTKYTFFSIENGFSYQSLKKPLTFSNDELGFSNWVLRFPLTVYTQNRLEKHVFTEDSVTISIHRGIIEEQRWMYFVTTKRNGQHLYCTAQTFYEKRQLTQCTKLNHKSSDSFQNCNAYFYVPNCLILMSDEPYFKMHVNLLRIYREILKSSPNISHPTDQKTISQYLRFKADGKKDQFFLTPKNEVNKSVQANLILDYYISKCNEHLHKESILIEKTTNFPILHLYTLNNNQLFQFSHFFNLPLSNKTISSVLTAILLQKQVIVTSKSQNLNVMIIESFLSVIKPLKWQHMLVHNLPKHLIEAANQNFMPFIVGISKKELQFVNTDNKYILLLEEDVFLIPQALPSIGSAHDTFSRQLLQLSPPPHHSLNERLLRKSSIQFMCQLLRPVIKSRRQNTSLSGQFYESFSQTALFEFFIEHIDQGESNQFIRIASIDHQQERKLKIQRRINEVTYSFQNPKRLVNEIEWIQYYLTRKKPVKNTKIDGQARLLTLKQIKQNAISESSKQKLNRTSCEIHKIRSHSCIQSRNNKSIQKIKVSVIKQDPYSPLLKEIIHRRLGVDRQVN